MNHNNFEMKTIFLIGMMGTGKTTIGAKLSKRLGFAFYDLDRMIEKKNQKSVSEIFSEFGESYFREQEAKFLKKTPLLSSVVATGGGIVENETNCNWIKQFGIAVLLEANDLTILSRIKNDRTRPLLHNNPEEVIRDLKQKRYQDYHDCAHFVIQTDDKSEDDIVKEIMNKISSNVQEYFVFHFIISNWKLNKKDSIHIIINPITITWYKIYSDLKSLKKQEDEHSCKPIY